MATEVDSANPPETSLQLTDLIDLATLQAIQDTFAKVFGLPTVIIDQTGRNITNITHRVSFCEDLTRRSPIAGERCNGCDMRAVGRAARTNRPAIFRCWNGLYDCAIPIAPKGEVLGHFLCGQILSEPADTERFAMTAREIGVQPSRYQRALGGVRVVPLSEYRSSIATMHTLAQMIAEQAAASMDNLKMLQEALAAKSDAAKLVEELEVILEALRDSFAQPDEQSTLETIADQLQRMVPYDSCLIYTMEPGEEELVPRIVRDPNPEPFEAYRPRSGTGLWGRVVATGVRRRIDDVRDDPDFEAVPGVDLEPEAMLVVPMIRKGTVFGVISLSRFERRAFTDHELRILAVFSAHASQSMQVARMQAQNLRRVRQEQALGELLRTMAEGLRVDETLMAIGRCGIDLLGARAAVLSCHPEPGARTDLARIGIGRDEADRLLLELEPEIASCQAAAACRVHTSADAAYLLVPLQGASEVLGVGVFQAPAGPLWDQLIVEAFAHQSSLGLRDAIARGRERRVVQQNELLAALGMELAHAKSLGEVRARLLARTSETLGSDLSALAMLDQSRDAIQTHVREGRTAHALSIKLEARGRLAAARLTGETGPENSVFDAWAQDLAQALSRKLGIVSHMAAPVRTPSGVVGGLFVAWRTDIRRFSGEQKRLLEVIAAEAGTSFTSLLAGAETHGSLRRRLADAHNMARFAEQIMRLTEKDAIVDEALAAVQQLAGLSGAVYATRMNGQWAPVRAVALDDEEVAAVSTALDGLSIDGEPARHDLKRGTRQLLTVPLRANGHDAGVIAGAVTRRGDTRRDKTLAELARFTSEALANADLHNRQRSAIARLEDAHDGLQQILSVQEILTADVVGGRGIQSVADSLANLIRGEVLVVGSLDTVLARAPATSDLGWPASCDSHSATTTTEQIGEHHIVTVPAAFHDETLAWLVARFEAAPSHVERASLEYAALLVALDQLRERTAMEVEHRLRGGFVEELFSGAFVEDLIIKQGAAFGFDLTAPSRILLIEQSDAKATQADRRQLYTVITESAARWPARHLVALDGDAVVVLIAEPGPDRSSQDRRPAFEERPAFEDEIERALRGRVPTIGFNIAVSRLVRSLADYGRAYAAARRGLDFLRLLGRSGQTVSFRKMGVQEILLQVEEPAGLVDFIRRYVEPLERYDAEHASSLLTSLETFYDSGFNLQESARKLGVHVSTLRYRLTRIEELLGVDPKVGESRLNIEVAVRAARALAVHRSS